MGGWKGTRVDLGRKNCGKLLLDKYHNLFGKTYANQVTKPMVSQFTGDVDRGIIHTHGSTFIGVYPLFGML